MICNLTCNNKIHPIDISDTLMLHWNLSSGRQDAFSLQICLGEQIVFESGIVKSSATNYSLTLKFAPEREYAYTLTVFSGTKQESARGAFRTTIGAFGNGAKWIGARDGSFEKGALYVRKKFCLNEYSQAHLFIAGLGLYEAYINGQSVAESVLNQPFTDYSKCVYFDTYEIGTLLTVGENELTVVLGNGFYNPTVKDEWDFHRAPWKDGKKTIFEIHADEQKIVSDETCLCGSGPLTDSEMRIGERYDAAAEYHFENAVERKAPQGRVLSDIYPHVIQKNVRKYCSAVKIPNGFLLDFGENIAGFASVDLYSEQGGTVLLRYGDTLKDGRIDNTSDGQYVYGGNEFSTDAYTVAPRSRLCQRARFAYHGFRYIEAEGISQITPSMIQAVQIMSDAKRVGNFECDNAVLNALYRCGTASVEANYVDIPTDCPHREKNGWTGDAGLSAEQFLYNYDLRLNLYKWLDDIAFAQTEAGDIPCIVPSSGWGYNWGQGTSWDIAMFLLVYALYNYNGDSFAVARYLPMLEKYFAWLKTQEQDGLIVKGLGDWCYPRRIPIAVCPVWLSESGAYYSMARMLAYFYRLQGDFGKSEQFQNKAECVRKSIIRMLQQEQKSVIDSVGALACVLYYHIVSDEQSVLNRLVRILEQNGFHYNAGILGVKWVNHALCEHGRTDVFVRLLQEESYPSFANWLRQGAVTLWEDFEGTNSHNHHMFSDIGCCMMQYLAGIQKEQERVVICPNLQGFRSLSARTDFGNGTISVRFENDTLEIFLPPNTAAVLRMNDSETALSEGINRFTVPKQ